MSELRALVYEGRSLRPLSSVAALNELLLEAAAEANEFLTTGRRPASIRWVEV